MNTYLCFIRILSIRPGFRFCKQLFFRIERKIFENERCFFLWKKIFCFFIFFQLKQMLVVFRLSPEKILIFSTFSL
ncbi:MAG TPA: hypothetical protein DCP98_00380 [Sphaerochaeta sp.]|nr:hypothetical protein [Sphaerochaeta sp.]